MRKKTEEYIPQFDYSNFDEEQYKKETNETKCLYCGKPSVSLSNGVCFSCRSKIDPKNKVTYLQEPNFGLYLDWCKQKSFEKGKSIGKIIYYPLFKYGYASIWFIGSIWWAVSLFANIKKIENFSEILYFILFVVFNLAMGIIFHKLGKKRNLSKFKKFNEMNIQSFDNTSWVCPCCHYINEQLAFCRNCGVFPSSLKQKN